MNKSVFPRWIKATILVAILAIALLVVTYAYNFGGFGNFGSQEQFGLFGDYLGGSLNPILSFITIVLLIWSINVQVAELRSSVEALNKTRDVHNEQIALSEKQYIRKQLLDDARMYLERVDELLNRPAFKLVTTKPDPEFISVNDLFKNRAYYGNKNVVKIIESVPEFMSSGCPEGILLSKIKTQLALAVNTICPLILYLDLQVLRNHWTFRASELIVDCKSLAILTEQEADELSAALLGAQNIRNQT